MTDRVEHGQPELLGVLLIALHLEHGEPRPRSRTFGPRAQQRRLAASGRRRADRDLPRRSDVFPRPAGAEMIVTFRAAPGSRAARRSARSISWGVAEATVRTLTSVTQSWPRDGSAFG